MTAKDKVAKIIEERGVLQGNKVVVKATTGLEQSSLLYYFGGSVRGNTWYSNKQEAVGIIKVAEDPNV